MFSLAFGRSGQVGRGLLKPPAPSPPPFSRRVHQRNGVCPAASVCRILLTLSLWYPFACSSAPRISRELVGFPRSVRSHVNFLFQSPVSPPRGPNRSTTDGCGPRWLVSLQAWFLERPRCAHFLEDVGKGGAPRARLQHRPRWTWSWPQRGVLCPGVVGAAGERGRYQLVCF